MDRELLARRLITLVHGLGAHSALHPKHRSPAKQRRIIEKELRSLPAMQLREEGPPSDHTPLPLDAARKRERNDGPDIRRHPGARCKRRSRR
jgi:hypothetical protein